MIELPWPHKDLNPNARVHWTKKASAAKMARDTAFKITLVTMQCLSISLDKSKKINFVIEFYPPGKRKYDDDNLIASFKPYRDGIADALRINDVSFKTIANIKEVVKGGKVIVKLTNGE